MIPCFCFASLPKQIADCRLPVTSPPDFPLSRTFGLSPPSLAHALPAPLPSSYLHLAAQMPSTWLIPTNLASVKLAIRKVVWRALIGGLIAKSNSKFHDSLQDKNRPIAPMTEQDDRDGPEHEGDGGERRRKTIGDLAQERGIGTGETPVHRRLGKINDRAYDDWKVFLRVAGEKMGFDFARLDSEDTRSGSSAVVCSEPSLDPTSSPFTSARSQGKDQIEKQRTPREEELEAIQKRRERARRRTESRLEVLHTLRCLLGPLVEGMILLDRLILVREELADIAGGSRSEMEVELVNLFDQATGSGRNVGLVIKSPDCLFG
jgi:hypothetical protein